MAVAGSSYRTAVAQKSHLLHSMAAAAGKATVGQTISDGLDTRQLVEAGQELRYVVHHVRNGGLRSIPVAVVPLAQNIDENLVLGRIPAIGDSYVDEEILASLSRKGKHNISG